MIDRTAAPFLFPAQDPQRIGVEAANVANWAMFLADNYGALQVAHDGRGKQP